MMYRTLGALLLLSLPFSTILADSDERFEHFLSLSLEELISQKVSISTNTPQPLDKAPGVISIITADDIRATGATNLVEVLEGVPGIHVRANHFAFRPLIQFRGANATQTLLMVNGVPLRDLMWGFGIFWKGLPASIIERVEIIRGPGSALFGSDASAGVINVITRTAVGIERNEAGMRGGSFNTRSGWALLGDEWGGYRVSLSTEFSSTEGHSPFIAEDRQSVDDPASSLAPAEAEYGWDNRDLRLAVAKGSWQLLADYMQHTDLEVGVTGAGVLDPLTHAEDSRYNFDLLYDNDTFADNWGLRAALRYHHLDYDSGEGFQERPPGYFDGTTTYPDGVINRMSSAERRTGIEVSGQYRGFLDHTIHVGVGHTVQDLYRVEQWITDSTNPTQLLDLSDTTAAFAPENARTINHIYLQDLWAISNALELTTGIRYDDYSDFGCSVNPRLALVWKNTAQLTTKLMYGEAFRAPSYRELYASTSYAQPNPNLEPERSQTTELAMGYAVSGSLQLDLNVFHFEQDALIRRNTGTGQYENSGYHSIHGAELEAQWQASDGLKLVANLARRNQDVSDYRALDEADVEAYLRLDWAFTPYWNWNLQGNWVGDRPRAPSDSRDDAPAYLITDTTLRYAGYAGWEFAASVRNLFDEEAQASSSLAEDLPLPGRSYYAELRYTFGGR